MSATDAVATGLLVVVTATLVLMAIGAYRRTRNRSFLLLGIGFAVLFVGGAVLSLSALGLAFTGGVPVSIVAGTQALSLAVIYAASFLGR